MGTRAHEDDQARAVSAAMTQTRARHFLSARAESKYRTLPRGVSTIENVAVAEYAPSFVCAVYCSLRVRSEVAAGGGALLGGRGVAWGGGRGGGVVEGRWRGLGGGRVEGGGGVGRGGGDGRRRAAGGEGEPAGRGRDGEAAGESLHKQEAIWT